MNLDLSAETIRLLLVLVITSVTHLVASRLLRHAERVASRTNNVWDDALIAAARRPLPMLIWLGGLSFFLHLVHRQTGEQLLEYLPLVRNIGIIICVSWFLFRLIREVANNLVSVRSETGEAVDRTTIDGVSKVLRIAVFVLAVLGVMQTLGFSISGVLAFGGMGGIAVGFAAKDLLANFFGALTIHLDRPFAVGDTVRSPDKQIEGKVEQIGWRQTVIRSPNMTPIYVPNSLFTSIVVENPSRMTHRRIRETIGLRYEDLGKVGAIVEDVRAMLNSHPEIDTQQAVVVAFDQFADSSLNLLVQAYSKTTEAAAFQTVKQDVLLKVATIVSQHGADFAYPTRTLHVVQHDA
jgi:MscS family membrane protein